MGRNVGAGHGGGARLGLGEIVAREADAGLTFDPVAAPVGLAIVVAGATFGAVGGAAVDPAAVAVTSFGARPAFALAWRWNRRTSRCIRHVLAGCEHRGHACRGFPGGSPSFQRQTGLRCGRWGRPTREEPVEHGDSGSRRALHNSHLANRHKFTFWIPLRGPLVISVGMPASRARSMLSRGQDRSSCTRAKPNISSVAVGVRSTARTSMPLAIQASEGSASVPNEKSWCGY